MQDLGAAGITSSASEMAASGGVGIEIETDKIPLRESGMEPWEVMISESQERMLAVVEPEKADEVLARRTLRTGRSYRWAGSRTTATCASSTTEKSLEPCPADISPTPPSTSGR